MDELVRIGIGGPVGSGKTSLVEQLCKRIAPQLSVAAVTNDIYTLEDAEYLARAGALPLERIVGVETGGCPHQAIREDASLNLEAIAGLRQRIPDLRLVLVESGGDNLAASFSSELVEASIYVIDVAGGDKIPRKGGPGVCRSDLLIINKIDLAGAVGASLSLMETDTRRMRGEGPYLFTNLKTGEGLGAVVEWVLGQVRKHGNAPEGGTPEAPPGP